jgi:hypothetical protein
VKPTFRIHDPFGASRVETHRLTTKNETERFGAISQDHPTGGMEDETNAPLQPQSPYQKQIREVVRFTGSLMPKVWVVGSKDSHVFSI